MWLFKLKIMEEVRTAKKSNNLLAFFGLTLMLFVLPAGSYYYLKSGWDHRMSKKSELQELGTIGTFQLNSIADTLVSAEQIQGRLTVAGFINGIDKAQRQRISEVMLGLGKQFDDRKDFHFLLHSSDTSATTLAALKQFHSQRASTDFATCTVVKDGANQAIKEYKLPSDTNPENTYLLTLIDSKGMVRGHYDISDNAGVNKLIEHIVLVMPPKPKKEIILKRDQEK